MAAKRRTICVMDLERRLWFTAGLHFKIRYLIIYIQNHHCNLIIHKLNYGIYINLIMMLVINVILYPPPFANLIRTVNNERKLFKYCPKYHPFQKDQRFPRLFIFPLKERIWLYSFISSNQICNISLCYTQIIY